MQVSLFTKVLSERPFEDVIEIAADLGFDAIEPRGREPHLPVDTPPDAVADYAEKLEARDLNVAGLATYTGGYDDCSDAEREAELEDLRRYCSMAETLGCDLVRHNPGGPAEHRASESDYETAATWMRRAADVAAEHGVRLGMEIHHGSLIETAAGTVDLIERIDRPNVGAIHDAGNMYIADVEYGKDSIETLGDRVFQVHCKGERRVEDADRAGGFELETRHGREAFQHTFLEDGANDHAPAIAALAERGYSGHLSVECHRPSDGEWSDVDIAEHELAQLRKLIESA